MGRPCARARAAIAQADRFMHLMHPTVQAWYRASETCDLASIECDRNIGHVKHAFTLAVHFLRQATPYE